MSRSRHQRPPLAPKAKAALQLTYELQIVPTAGYDLLFGSKSNRSEQLARLVALELLAHVPDPERKPGPPTHFYAVTRKAYPYLRSLPPGVPRRPPAVELTAARLQAPGTRHLLAAGAFARACLFGLPTALAPQWHGEPSTRATLAPDHSGTPGTYLEPDGVLLTASALPAFFYECDRGTECGPKWQAKIGRDARAAAQRVYAARYGAARPPLLVTCRSAESAAEIAGYLARQIAAHAELWDWSCWIAVHDQVAHPEGITAAVWQQVRPGSPGGAILDPDPWTLPDILPCARETPRRVELRRQHEEAAARAR